MIKRPLNPRFTAAVLDGRKFTTIREKPWPVGVPIMLYNWSGKAYRSPQINVAAVIVKCNWQIRIEHFENGKMFYQVGLEDLAKLHEMEGFESREAMDDWFRSVVKPGHVITRYLMRFSLLSPPRDTTKAELLEACEIIGASLKTSRKP